MPLKRCNHCKLELPLDEFYRLKSSKDGRQRECKVCQNDKRKRRERKGGVSEASKVNRRNKRRENCHVAPKWQPALEGIKNLVDMRIMQESLTKQEYHLGHIHPIAGELVSGLHIPANMMLEPAKYNLSHGNDFTPYRICQDTYYELRNGVWVECSEVSWHKMVNPRNLNAPYTI